MPRNVRNYWLEAVIDGRASKFSAGPASKDGGFSLKIFMRNDGSASHALTVSGRADPEGKLQLEVTGEDLYDITTSTLNPRRNFRVNSVR